MKGEYRTRRQLGARPSEKPSSKCSPDSVKHHADEDGESSAPSSCPSSDQLLSSPPSRTTGDDQLAIQRKLKLEREGLEGGWGFGDEEERGESSLWEM